MYAVKGFGFLTLAVLACPCHLVLVLGVLGGTTIGALAANFVPAFVLLDAVLVGAVGVGLRALESGSGRACARDAGGRTP